MAQSDWHVVLGGDELSRDRDTVNENQILAGRRSPLFAICNSDDEARFV